MVPFFRRASHALFRLTTVQDVDHEVIFDGFARNVCRALMIERRVRDEPRVVSFPMRRAL